MASTPLPSPEVLRQLIAYDPDSGSLTWLHRDSTWFCASATRSAEHVCRLWNARYAGAPALNYPRGGYLVGLVLSVPVRAHRVAWAIHHGRWPRDRIDHIDGDGTNNRLENMREVSAAENARNAAPHKKASCLPPGVKEYQRKQGRLRFQARICVAGRSRSLGYFASAEDAHAAYRAALLESGFSERHGATTLYQ